MEELRSYGRELNLKATELRLGPLAGEDIDKEEPLSARINKRSSPEMAEEKSRSSDDAPCSKAIIVGWPPVQSFRRNSFQLKKAEAGSGNGMYVKVSMHGAPYLRKVDLKVYEGYPELLKALESMFKIKIGEYSETDGYHGSEYAPTYEDKDGDWMLVGDVPWEMFTSSCKKLRLMKGTEAQGSGSL